MAKLTRPLVWLIMALESATTPGMPRACGQCHYPARPCHANCTYTRILLRIFLLSSLSLFPLVSLDYLLCPGCWSVWRSLSLSLAFSLGLLYWLGPLIPALSLSLSPWCALVYVALRFWALPLCLFTLTHLIPSNQILESACREREKDTSPSQQTLSLSLCVCASKFCVVGTVCVTKLNTVLSAIKSTIASRILVNPYQATFVCILSK